VKTNPNVSAPVTAFTEQPPLVMSLLKTETANAHRQLERTSSFVRLFSPDYALPEYKQLLGLFYGFHVALEPLLFDGLSESHHSVLGHKVKTGLLAKDLATFGDTEAEIAKISRCDELPQLSSFARQMGALYVLEGSVLGGRIISKRLKEHFGDDVLDKLNYYTCYGEHVGTEWKGFQSFMGDQFADESEQIPEVIAAANDTFMALHQWFDRA
jgi:heme oxygenase (biliverdin-IX-beta and delta-forming)